MVIPITFMDCYYKVMISNLARCFSDEDEKVVLTSNLFCCHNVDANGSRKYGLFPLLAMEFIQTWFSTSS